MSEDCSSKRWGRSMRTDEQSMFVDEDCVDSRSDVDDLRTLSDDEEDWTYKQGLPSQAHEKRNNQLYR